MSDAASRQRRASVEAVLTATLRRELAPRFRHARRHASCGSIGVRVNDIGTRLLHADVARKNQFGADANA